MNLISAFKSKNILYLFSILLVSVLILYPYWIAGFFFDDVYNSVTKGFVSSSNISIVDYIFKMLDLWVVTNGRFFPLAIVTGYATWNILDSLLLARLYQVSLALINFLFLFLIVEIISKNKRLAAMAVLMLGTLIQFNPRWDGLAGFTALNQITFLLCEVSLYLTCKACSENNVGNFHGVVNFLGALFFATCAALMYEIGVLGFIFCGLILIYTKVKKKQYIKYSFLILGLFIILYALGSIYFRVNAGGAQYDGVELGSFDKFPITLFYQITSVFPFAFFNNKVLSKTEINHLIMLFLALIIYASWKVMIKKSERYVQYENEFYRTRSDIFVLIVIGTLLLLVPAVLVSISSRYQKIISYGDPYIVIYVQYFGLAILFALCLEKLFNTYRHSVDVAIILISVVTSVTILYNYERINLKNKTFKDPRVKMERLLNDENFSKLIPEEANLLVDSHHMWETSVSGDLCTAFFSHQLLKKIRCITIEDYSNKIIRVGGDFNKSNLYYLRRVDDMENNDTSINLVGGKGAFNANYRDNKWYISAAQVGYNSITMPTKSVGFYPEESNHGKIFTWASGSSEIKIFHENFETAPSKVRITFELMSVADQSLRISINDELIWESSLQKDQIISIYQDINLINGINILKILVDGGVGMKAPGDPRVFFYQLRNLSFDVLK